MVDAVLFDADGTLFDVRSLQHEALCRALAGTGWKLPRTAAAASLPTQEKLRRLTDDLCFPSDWHAEIHKLEVLHLSDVIEDSLSPRPDLRRLMLRLLCEGVGLGVMAETPTFATRHALARLGVDDLVEGIVETTFQPGFRAAAERVGTRVERCLAVVGSERAADSARRSGARSALVVAPGQAPCLEQIAPVLSARLA